MGHPESSPDRVAMTRLTHTLFVKLLIIAMIMTISSDQNALADPTGNAPVAIAIHGGAGTIRREDMTAEREAEFRAALEEAVRVGHGVLSAGGASLDAVRSAINLLEDSPLFNAGKGSVFNAEGKNELDASVMDGATRNAGAVAGVAARIEQASHPASDGPPCPVILRMSMRSKTILSASGCRQ